MFKAITCTRHLFNAHVWVGVTESELARWEDQLRPMFAMLARAPLRGLKPFQFSVAILAGLARLLPPGDSLHLARLRYLKRLLRQCPLALWTFLCQDTSSTAWLAQCRQSLDWFAVHYPHVTGISASATIEQCLTFISLDDSWKGRLRHAVLACKRFRHAQALHVCHIAQFEQEFRSIGAVLPQTPPLPLDVWIM